MKSKSNPIIVANTHWDLPENLLKDVNSERMINSLIEITTPLKPEESVGWAECVAYLMPASQQAPLRSDVTKIYLYCVTQLLKRKGKYETLPKECVVDELTDYEMQKLNEFKRWLYNERGGKIKNPVVDVFQEVFKDVKKSK